MDLRDHGWFMFFAPRDNPEIAGVVFLEHGDPQRRTPRRSRKHILETYFAKKEGRPLPPPPTRDDDAGSTIERSGSRAAARAAAGRGQ